jgi:tripartite-type tricarboxylate transporter receptor subunit TctC
LAGGAAAFSVSHDLSAQTYPARPVRLIVGFPPGGTSDILARLTGQWLSEHLGQQFVVDNRPGAAGNIGADAAVRAPRDGYTLLLINAANASNATLYDKLSFNFIRDISPVASIYEAPFVLIVNPSIPATTLPEFIRYARANPGKLNVGSPGAGSTVHLCGEMFKMMAGLELVHVQYRGGAPALTDLMAGQVHAMFATVASAMPYIRAGKVRPLAVTTAMRSEALPDIPTVSDFVLGYEASDWYGIGVPNGTPASVIDKLRNNINSALADPRFKSRLAELGGMAFTTTPADFTKRIAVDTAKWAKVVKFSGAKPE